MKYQLKVYGSMNPETYHFSDPRDLADWLLAQESIVEVMVNEV